MEKNIDSIVERLRKVFVSIETFELRVSPLEKVIYGFIGLFLVSFATLVIAFFFRAR